MNIDYKILRKGYILVLFSCLYTSYLSAQIALNLSNDTRANDRYCDHAAQVFTGCGGSYTDDGGSNLYSNDLVDIAAQNSPANDYGDDVHEPIFWTFCPNNPTEERVKLTFTEFDIHSSDQFLVYDGACDLANGDIDPNIGVVGLDDDNQLDFNNFIQLTGGSPGQMTQIAGSGTVENGAGWVEASCTNVSGCITIGWNPNGDNNKGLGWRFSTSCSIRSFDISCPTTGDGNAPNGIASYDGLTVGCGQNITLPVPAAAVDGCAGTGNTLLAPPYIVEVIIDGLSLGFVGGNLTDYPEMTIGVGRHTLIYVLYFDINGDNNPFDGTLIEKKRVDCVFTISDSEDLVCPAETNISLGDDCATKLLPKEILSNLCAPAYPIRVIIDSKTYTANCRGCDFVDANDNPLFLEEGLHDYIMRDNCNNACFGRINLKDIQAPQCIGPVLTGILCSEPIPDNEPNFLDCNEIIATNFLEFEYGACGQYSLLEVNELQDVLSSNNFIETTPGIFIIGTSPDIPGMTGSGTSILDLPINVNGTIESITVRRWRVTDSNGNTNENCPQAFANLRPDSLFMPNLPSIEVKCGEGITPEELLQLKNEDGSPRFAKQNLAPWFVSPFQTIPNNTIEYILPDQETNCHYATFYEDQLIQTIGETQKISRTWTWLDWCSPTPQRTASFVQIIKIADEEEPVLTSGPDAMRFSLDLFECQRSEVNLQAATWNDVCGSVVSYRTELRAIQSNGNIGGILQNNFQNGGQFTNLEVGDYYVLYYAEDQNGNETSSFGSVNNAWEPVPGNVHVTTLSIIDGVKPQARCINQLNITLRSNQDRINAIDFDAGSSDNCGIAELGISLLDVDGTFGPFLNLDCSDIGKNLRIFLQATDIHGNKNVCWGDVRILSHEDNTACNNLDEIIVTGEITNDNGEFLEPVTIIASAAGQPDIISTTEFGQYNLALSKGTTYTITPQKNTNATNGVSTFDLVLINQHILDIKRFTSPYQYIAADVNKSGNVTAFDLLQLRQLILNQTVEFRDNTSWRFVDTGYNFGSDISSTLSQNFAESMEIIAPDNPNINLDFIGVKIGDVNGTAAPNQLLNNEDRSWNESMTIEIADRWITAGETFNIQFDGIALEQYLGLQFTLDFPTLEVLSLEENLLQKEHWHIPVPHQLITSWNGTTNSPSPLLKGTFKALETGYISDFLKLNSTKMEAEAYTSQGEIHPIELVFNQSTVDTKFELLQSHPNPTNNWTTIPFNLPTKENYTLKVIDLNGRILQQISDVGERGLNQVQLQTKAFGVKGLVYYQLQTDTELATERMIITQ